MMALGFIETKGLIAAIEAADAMLKAADVRLLEKNQVGSGLVTISIAGEVAAVKAAVDAAVVAIQRIPGACLISQHVIARPDVELAYIVTVQPMDQEKPVSSRAVESKTAAAPEKVQPQKIQSLVETSVSPAKKKEQRYESGQLKKMNMDALRQYAQTLDKLPLTPAKIATANKKELIEAIMKTYRQIEE